MARQGLNGTFTYSDGTKTYTYQFRAGILGYGVDMIYAEDQGRTTRAFYPHRSANQQFSVQVLLKDWDERADLTSWLVSYAQFALDPNAVRTVFPFMQVTVPVRNFTQQGMPLSGYEWGAHTGMNTFSPVYRFEAAQSPGQTSASVLTSSVLNTAGAFASDPAVQYFYPFGTQLQASQVPQNYGQVLPPPPVPPAGPPASAPNPGITPAQLAAAEAQIGVINSGTVTVVPYPSPGIVSSPSNPGVAAGTSSIGVAIPQG